MVAEAGCADKERQRDDGGNAHHSFTEFMKTSYRPEEQKSVFRTALTSFRSVLKKQNILSAVVHGRENAPYAPLLCADMPHK